MQPRLPPEYEAVMMNAPKELRSALKGRKRNQIFPCPVSDTKDLNPEAREKEAWPYNEKPTLRWLEGDTLWDLASRHTYRGCAILLIKRGWINEDNLFWPRFMPIKFNSPMLELSAPRVGHFVNLMSCPGGRELEGPLLAALSPEQLAQSLERFPKDAVEIARWASLGNGWAKRGFKRIMENALFGVTMDVAVNLNNFQPFKDLIDTAASQSNASDYMIACFYESLKIFEKSKLQTLLKENLAAGDAISYAMVKCQEVLRMPPPEQSEASPTRHDRESVNTFLDEHAHFILEWRLRQNALNPIVVERVKV